MIRPAAPADAPAVRRLQRLLPHRAPALLDAALDGDRTTGEVLVAADAGVDGYALAVPGARSAAPSSVVLAELVVASAARREGTGTALVEAVAARYAGYDELRVVAAADSEACAFYEAVGFRARERLPDRFDGVDGRLLLRRLA